METTEKKKENKPAGIVATIVNAIEKAGEKGISHKEILVQLKRKFPDHDFGKMERTVKLHIPGLMSKERFKIVKIEGTDKYRKEDLKAKSRRKSDARYGFLVEG